MLVIYTIYAAKDSFGNSFTCVTDDPYTEREHYLSSIDGANICFYNELYLLKSWCERNGFEYYEKSYEERIDF